MKCCRYCCYAARLIDKDKDKDNKDNNSKMLFCSKLGMSISTERYNCIYFQKPLK